MDYEKEIVRLAAENLATQALLVGLLNSLATSGKGDIVETGFRYAEMGLEAAVLGIGDRIPHEQTICALKGLEQLHAMYLPLEKGADD